jgi:hypothetical protein
MGQSKHQVIPPSIQNPKTARLRAARPVLRQAGSAVLECAPFLDGNDFIVAARLVDACDLLLIRFSKLERRVSP